MRHENCCKKLANVATASNKTVPEPDKVQLKL
jgi:hypothetical protein